MRRRTEAVARRYARALFAVAREADRLESAREELGRVVAAVHTEPALGEFLRRPWVEGERKRAAVLALAEGLGCSTPVKELVGLLAARGRVDLLEVVAGAFGALLDEARGRVRARVRSAVPLGPAERRALAERLGRATGKTVVVEESVDAGLLGGFVAQVGSLVWDGSLAGQLARMRERLVRG
jgi:F-type H+-transporting ATPase subunit delta